MGIGQYGNEILSPPFSSRETVYHEAKPNAPFVVKSHNDTVPGPCLGPRGSHVEFVSPPLRENFLTNQTALSH